ncbi:MAG TPA: TonB-dependent receptor, partial [Gemmatimonadales bacterium]|nr:TonB-dependent receptor [Gemmatimonadales bacterium]
MLSLGLATQFLLGAVLQAQSLTSGSLRGSVQTSDGEPVAGASVSLESRAGAVLLSLETDRLGGFQAQLLTPGEYRILVEEIGYQPLRATGVVVTAGTVTTVLLTIERRPPPITSVTEVANPGARGGAIAGASLSGNALTSFNRPRDLGGLGRDATTLIPQGDGREGLGLGGGGLPVSHSRLFVDGVMETLLRHPGLPAEPLSAPVFQRNGLNQVQFLGLASDLEWRGVPGTLVSGQSRTGAGGTSFAPYATFSSAKLGQRRLDNPGDSTASSLAVGGTLNFAIVRDTAHLFIEGGYQSLEQPTAAPWANDSTRFQGQPALLSVQVPEIGATSFQTALVRFAAPTVRTWKGGHGSARLDWQIGRTSFLLARLGFASWKEENPLLGTDGFSGAGTSMKGRDFSGAAALTTAGASVANELRAGFSMARREWLGSPVTGTLLSADGMGLGTAPTLPATFDVKRVDLSDALQYALGHHRLKGGVSLGILNYDQTYRYGAGGLYQFGDLDSFAAANGTFFQVAGAAGSAKHTIVSPGVFLQDTWAASPEIQVQLGLRYETQLFPKNKIALDTAWRSASGIANNFTPGESKVVSPRMSFVWSLRGGWVVRGSGGLYQADLDPSLFAEALLFDGGSTVRRGQGVLAGWPADPGGALAPTVGRRLTLFSDRYRTPRTAKFDFGFARSFSGGTTFSLGGSYGHTDYLQRRTDLNRAESGGRTTQEGRPVYGTLVKQGALITAAPASNRLFDTYDLVSGLAPTGFVDHYEVSASLDRRVSRGLSLGAGYTYGRTTDNLVGLLQADPADQLDPFPEGIPGGGDWSSGRSDLDVTHRLAATAEYRSTGTRPLVVGARWRWRSGLPFTPGFRPGVDLNGDGGGNNDPVRVEQGGLPNCAGAAGGDFAPRNSCRAGSVQALDLRL